MISFKSFSAIGVSSLIALTLALLLSSCSSKNQDESELPWATPATWEGQLPGIGGG